jgi:hypothetical protein
MWGELWADRWWWVQWAVYSVLFVAGLMLMGWAIGYNKRHNKRGKRKNGSVA